jgi:hypothetical protein
MSAPTDAQRISERYCQLYQQHKAGCTAVHCSNNQLTQRGTVWQSEAKTAAGPVRLCAAHPLHRFVAAPKMPADLLDVLDNNKA